MVSYLNKDKKSFGKSQLSFDNVIIIQFWLKIMIISLRDPNKMFHISGKNNGVGSVIEPTIKSVFVLSIQSNLHYLDRCPDR